MVNVTEETFEAEVLQARLPTLVDFWAEWCGPCRMVAPIVEAVANEYDGRLKVVKMDVDANPSVPGQLGIRGIPTLILFKNGEEVERLVGYRSQEALQNAIQPHLG